MENQSERLNLKNRQILIPKWENLKFLHALRDTMSRKWSFFGIWKWDVRDSVPFLSLNRIRSGTWGTVKFILIKLMRLKKKQPKRLSISCRICQANVIWILSSKRLWIPSSKQRLLSMIVWPWKSTSSVAVSILWNKDKDLVMIWMEDKDLVMFQRTLKTWLFIQTLDESYWSLLWTM